MSNFLSFFTENTVSLETGYLLLLVCIFWLTCLWHLIMPFLVWEIILLLLYKLKYIQIFQQEFAYSCVQKCRSTPIAVTLILLCTPIWFGTYSEITLTVIRTSEWLMASWISGLVCLAHSLLILRQPSLPMCTLLHHCNKLPLLSPSFRSVHLIPDTSPKCFFSTYEANPAFLSTWSVGVGTS